jgi:hypothetical protein
VSSGPSTTASLAGKVVQFAALSEAEIRQRLVALGLYNKEVANFVVEAGDDR